LSVSIHLRERVEEHFLARVDGGGDEWPDDELEGEEGDDHVEEHADLGELAGFGVDGSEVIAAEEPFPGAPDETIGETEGGFHPDGREEDGGEGEFEGVVEGEHG